MLKRKNLALEAYEAGRLNFTEILRRETIWDMIRLRPNGAFKLYPPQVTQEQVADHLELLIGVLQRYENYQLYLTDAEIPFVLVTYEVRSSNIPEIFTVFFQPFSSPDREDLGCFVVYDDLVRQSVSDHIADWLLSHPSTVRNKTAVIDELRTVRDYLEEHGPLKSETPKQVNASTTLVGNG